MNTNDLSSSSLIQKNKSRQEIQEWLLHWLLPMHSNDKYFSLNEIIYEQHYFFRIAFRVYTITQNQQTGEWIWYRVENDYVIWDDFLKAPRFSTFSELIEYATDEFYYKTKK